MLAVDIGANVGNYISRVEAVCPDKQLDILAFEPNPINLPILRENLKNKEHINDIPMAVSDEEVNLTFYNYKTFGTNKPGNSLACLQGGGAFICNVPVTTLDMYLDQYPDHVIKFIKSDTEGNDTKVIYGMRNNISRVKYIIFECSDCLDDCRGPGEENPMKNCVDFLDQQGFDVYRIGSKRLIKVNGNDWNSTWEKVKFHSDCFALKKDDNLINQLIDSNGFLL